MSFSLLLTPTGLPLFGRCFRILDAQVKPGFHPLKVPKQKKPPKREAFLFVTPTGFKPVTAGAEIQCAIQLRHGANLPSGATTYFLVSVAPQGRLNLTIGQT